MRNIITAKNTTITEGLRSYMDRKFEKFDKYIDSDVIAHTRIEVKNPERHKVEVTIPLGMKTVRAEAVENDMYSAIDEVEDTVVRILRKHKEKTMRNKRRTHNTLNEIASEDVEQNDIYEIVRSKEHELESMSMQEACEEMEMTSHDFYVYCDSDRNDKICVVYVREDGKYGQLIFS